RKSGIRLLVIIHLFASVLSVGCAKIRPIWGNIANSTGPDNKSASSLEQTRIRYSCTRNNTYFNIEKSELTPEMVSPGSRIKHVLRYAFCAPAESAKVQGILTRKIKYKGKEVKISNNSDTEIFK